MLRRPKFQLKLIAGAACLHVAVTALPVFIPFFPGAPLRKAHALVAPYLNLLFLNHGYNFYAPEPGISQTLNIQFVVRGKTHEYWLQDEQLYSNDLAFIRHQGLAKAFSGDVRNSMALAESLSRFVCRKEHADSVRISWALHPELPRHLANAHLNPNEAGSFRAPMTVGRWTCAS